MYYENCVVTSTTFSTIYSNYAGTYSYGAVFYILSLYRMTLTSVTATDIYTSKTSSSNGEGRFMYYYSN